MVRGWCSRWWQRLHPGWEGRRGAAIGIVLATGIVAAVSAARMHPGLGVFDLPAGVLFGLAIAGAAGLATVLGLRLLAALPPFVTWVGFGALGALVAVLALIGVPPLMAVVLGLALGLVEALLGGTVAALRHAGCETRQRPRRRWPGSRWSLASVPTCSWSGGWRRRGGAITW